MTHPAEKLRSILNSESLSIAVCAHDPLTARLVQAAGFDNVFISGNAVAAFQFGLPDLGLLTLNDMVDVCRRITASVTIPVQVDADTGYGNAVQVTRTVEEFERAGAAGINLEDQVLYKKCAMIAGSRPVISAEEHVGKIKAAVASRRDDRFIVGARTDAAHEHGIDEAIRRAHLYADAGADLLDIEIKGTVSEIERIAAERFSVPLMANMDEGKELWRRDPHQLLAAGYRYAVHPGVLRYTLVRSAKEALAHLLKEGSTKDIGDRMCSVAEFFEAVDLSRYLKVEKAFLPGLDSPGDAVTGVSRQE